MDKKNTKPWLEDVNGEQVPQIIERDADIVLVEAGPGTGKTFGLTRRVQRILHPDGLNVPGEKVLVVAFNRVIAKQLSQDIGDCIDHSPHNGRPVIRTVHALCLQVIGRELRILLPHEVEMMIFDIICKHRELREEYETQPRAQQAFNYHIAKIEEHMQLWQAVDMWLLQHKARLISDLPGLLRDSLHGGDFTDMTFEHVIVDEFQDLTPGEQKLFLQFRSKTGTFVALGDPRQSIYAFRGNDREGLNTIKELPEFRGTSIEEVPMTECHRCPKDIVHAANQLMRLYPSRPMESTQDVTANTHVVYWKSEISEAKGLADAIAANIATFPKERHLVMVTRRQFGYRLRDQLVEINPELKIELSFSESLLETWPVREAFLYFCLLVDPDAPTWRAWLGYQNSSNGKKYKPPNRNADAYLKFLASCSDIITEVAVTQLAECSTQPPGKGGKNLWERAKRFINLKQLLQWNGEDGLALLNEVFDSAKWNVDQFDDFETARIDMEEILSKAKNIYHVPLLEKTDLTTQERLKEVATRLRYGIATREPLAPSEQSDLQVATLWGAKGVTAEHVYVLGLCDEAMPGAPRDEYPLTDEDFFEEQRRLFYVSITRSRRTLVLSRAKFIPNWRAAQLGLAEGKGNKDLRFLNMCRYQRHIIRFLPKAQKGETWKGCV